MYRFVVDQICSEDIVRFQLMMHVVGVLICVPNPCQGADFYLSKNGNPEQCQKFTRFTP